MHVLFKVVETVWVPQVCSLPGRPRPLFAPCLSPIPMNALLLAHHIVGMVTLVMRRAGGTTHDMWDRTLK